MKLRKLRSRPHRPAHRAESGRRPDRLGRGPDQPVWPSCVGERKRRREPLVRPAAINRGWGKGAAGVQGAREPLVRPAAAMLAYKAGLKNEGAATGYRNRQWKK